MPPADAPCSGQTVETYDDLGEWLYTHGRHYGPTCRCLACGDHREKLRRTVGLDIPPAPDWRATPHPSTSSSERRGEE
jgi:hypothetical protein